MNLKEIRQWLVQESGRYDLVSDVVDWVDNGANKYINSGQRMLDRMTTHPKMIGRNFQMLAAADYYKSFQDCRAIQAVWLTSITNGRTQLEKKDINWLRTQYSNVLTAEQSTPIYYCPAYFRAAPELHLTPIGDLTGYGEYMDVMYDAHYAYNGVLFYPPADGEYMLEVWAYFYSTQMTDDTHESWWSVNHPELLVMAAQCTIEKFQRNSEGVRDWMNVIQQEMQQLENDVIEEELSDVTQLEG